MEGEAQSVLTGNLKSIIWLLVPIITSGIVTFLITRYSTRTPVQNNILEKQLIQVFGPIEWIYRFIFPDNPEKSFDMIQEIIRENVAVVPVQLLRLWKTVTQSAKRSETLSTFLDVNEAFFEFSQYKLGYTAEILSEKHQTMAEVLIKSGHNNRMRAFKRVGIASVFFAVLMLGLFIFFLSSFYHTHPFYFPGDILIIVFVLIFIVLFLVLGIALIRPE